MRENNYTNRDFNPFQDYLTHGITEDDSKCPKEQREEFENFLIQEESERLNKERNKDEKVNELYAYLNNCSVTRSLLKSIILNDTNLS
jgi:hypothetical protein